MADPTKPKKSEAEKNANCARARDHHHFPEQKKREATERQAVRAKRSDREQLDFIKNRAGGSIKEVARLTKKIAESVK